MSPVFSPQEAQERETFLALMWALSHPGQARDLAMKPQDLGGLEWVGQAILDLETSFYTPDSALRAAFLRLGARATTPEGAEYQFYPEVGVRSLETLHQAPIGTLLAPEQSVTVVVGCALGSGMKLRLSGPGIQGQREIAVQGLPPDFWVLRNQRTSFPLGWDVFLLSEQGHRQVIGIPRSTKVEGVG